MPPTKKTNWLGGFATHAFWLAWWPLLVGLLEFTCKICSNLFFQTFFGPAQFAIFIMACLIAVANCWYKSKAPDWFGCLRSCATIIAIYWSLLLVPVLLLGTCGFLMAVAFSLGFALVATPVFVVCVLLATNPLLLLTGLVRYRSGRLCSIYNLGGLVLGILLLVLVEGPQYVTRYAVSQNDPDLLKNYGSQDLLLEMCYQNHGWYSLPDSSGYLLDILDGTSINGTSNRRADAERCGNLYYKITGTAFHTQRPPQKYFSGTTRHRTRFDRNRGGDQVFWQLDQLNMSNSRLEGHVDRASGLAYWEWTLEFQNTAPRRDQEARMQVLLPPQGVVSRLTLWVHGEPQEAAFSSVAKAAEAYKSVAVVRRRDPVLVRWVAPDRVLVQCFPVTSGGKMKIRLGILAPIAREKRLYLPQIIEKNFGYATDLATDFWLQGDLPLEMHGVSQPSATGKWREVHGKLRLAEGSPKQAYATCVADPQPHKVWTVDPFAAENQQLLVREISPAEHVGQTDKKPMVVVIDGSQGTAGWQSVLIDSLTKLESSGVALHLIVAAHGEVKKLHAVEEIRETV